MGIEAFISHQKTDLFVYPVVRNLSFSYLFLSSCFQVVVETFPLSDEMTFISEEEATGGWDEGFGQKQ
jgi:hypothetical protein